MEIRLSLQRPGWRGLPLALAITLTLLLAACNRASYAIPANSVTFAKCPLTGFSLPPGSVVEEESDRVPLWNARATVSCDWDTLLKHVTACAKSVGLKRFDRRDIEGKQIASFGSPTKGKMLVLVFKPEGQGGTCILALTEQ